MLTDRVDALSPPFPGQEAPRASLVARSKAVKVLNKTHGLDKVNRQYERAVKKVETYVGALQSIQAQTIQGAAYKSLVITSWLRAGYELHDLGEQLAMSILEDVRRLGAIVDVQSGRRRRRAAQ